MNTKNNMAKKYKVVKYSLKKISKTLIENNQFYK